MPDPLVEGTDPRIHIRIHTKIHGSGTLAFYFLISTTCVPNCGLRWTRVGTWPWTARPLPATSATAGPTTVFLSTSTSSNHAIVSSLLACRHFYSDLLFIHRKKTHRNQQGCQHGLAESVLVCLLICVSITADQTLSLHFLPDFYNPRKIRKLVIFSFRPAKALSS